MICAKCLQNADGPVHMCPITIEELDDRSRMTRVRDYLLGWLRMQIQLQLGMIGLTFQIRQYQPISGNIHLLALVTSWGSRQLGAVLQRSVTHQFALTLRLHWVSGFREFRLTH